ncbi:MULTISPECIES: hypothetical protein [Pseudomonadota]|uniref:hypothetical protein n=1 Tax=Pseudomonadota TaxID=1224 RepID=UPI00273153B9|nr:MULTISPECIES: hypothetical protein [Pseudomonadota]MDP1627648.1 hypothetical protein [Parvibaculum sp.]MDP2243750.1 hypothetical protein [Pseudomonas sp.]
MTTRKRGDPFTIDEANTKLQALRQIKSPPWRPTPSRQLADILGVSLQSLANWRVRGTGPVPEPHKKGQGNRMMYRPDVVMSWLSDFAGKHAEPWEFNQLWLFNQRLESMVPDRRAVELFILQADARRYF